MAERVRPIRYTVAAIRPRHFSFERCKAARIIYATLEHGSSQSGGKLQPEGGSPNVFVALSTAPGLPLRLLHFNASANLQLRYFKAPLFYSSPILQLPYFTASLFYSFPILQPPYFTAFGLYRSLDSYNTGFLKGFRFYERKRSIHLSDRIVKRLLAFLRIEIASISTPCDWKNEGRGANAVTERRAM